MTRRLMLGYNYLMSSKDWLAHNWFALVQSGILAAGLFSIAFSIHLDARARRVANLIYLTQQHRELWERMYSEPELSRILDPDVDLQRAQVTSQEEMFVVFIILHLSSTFYGIRSGFFHKPEGLRKDIKQFFSLPIPRAVWEKVKALQNADFLSFVEQSFPAVPDPVRVAD